MRGVDQMDQKQKEIEPKSNPESRTSRVKFPGWLWRLSRTEITPKSLTRTDLQVRNLFRSSSIGWRGAYNKSELRGNKGCNLNQWLSIEKTIRSREASCECVEWHGALNPGYGSCTSSSDRSRTRVANLGSQKMRSKDRGNWQVRIFKTMWIEHRRHSWWKGG